MRAVDGGDSSPFSSISYGLSFASRSSWFSPAAANACQWALYLEGYGNYMIAETLKVINVGLSFLLELAMLLAFGYWGFYGEKSLFAKWMIGIGIPLLIAVVWGIFFAPNAGHRLNSTNGSLLSLFLFLLSAVVLFYAQHSTLAIIFALTAIVNRVLVFVWKQW